MPRKLTPEKRRARREMILRALQGENQAALGREYGYSRQRVNEYVTKAIAEAEWRYEEAGEELEYWGKVMEVTK